MNWTELNWIGVDILTINFTTDQYKFNQKNIWTIKIEKKYLLFDAANKFFLILDSFGEQFRWYLERQY